MNPSTKTFLMYQSGFFYILNIVLLFLSETVVFAAKIMWYRDVAAADRLSSKICVLRMTVHGLRQALGTSRGSRRTIRSLAVRSTWKIAFGCSNLRIKATKKSFFAIPDPLGDRERCSRWLHNIETDKYNIKTYVYHKYRTRV